MEIEETPDVTYDDVGGCDEALRELREVVETPLLHPERFTDLGIGTALMEHCIRYAEKVGFLQLELDVVADNESAVKLYKRHGFVEFGRNPLGFRRRDGSWQEVILMRRELPQK